MKTRSEIEAGYAATIADEGVVNSDVWRMNVHQVQTMHEIACQLADLNYQLAKPGPGIQFVSGDDVINIHNGTVLINKGSIAAMTLSVPLAGAQSVGGEDGFTLRFEAVTNFAHTITTSTNGFNGTNHIITIVPPSSVLLIAYNGVWYLVGPAGGSLSG